MLAALAAALLAFWVPSQGASQRTRPPLLAAAAAADPAAAACVSLFPAWPKGALSGKRELDTVIGAFVATATTVPLKAASEPGDGYREWADGGFAAHKFIADKLSRKTYVPVLQLLLELVVASQRAYPDLYAVLKFVPKKNGLNPLLASLGEEPEGASLDITRLRPREVRRKLDDVQRALEQSWLLVCAYLTLPSRELRDDFLWSARTVVEKVKTDQRSKALEVLCLGAFGRSSALYALTAEGAGRGKEGRALRLKTCFEVSFGVGTWHPKPTNARMIWQRSRMVYPFLELAHRAWLDASRRAAAAGGAEPEPRAPQDATAVGYLLDRIARASPEEKVINSLLYWLIDISYKSMLEGDVLSPYGHPGFALRRAGVEAKLVAELAKMGHLLQLLSRSAERAELAPQLGLGLGGAEAEGGGSGPAGARLAVGSQLLLEVGSQLLLEVKEVETTCTLLASIKASCAEACPVVIAEYEQAMASPTLTLGALEQLEFAALAALLDVPEELVKERAPAVRAAMSEWRNPELLFRYLDDNRADPRMAALVTRWLRALFGLSEETLRQIRRESPENVRHLLQIPQQVLLAWYSERCPGTSRCKTLFMLGEDAGSCLRIISNEGNKYNRALMGYVLQSHVRALVVTDAVGRVLVRSLVRLVRSLVRLVLRSDTLSPVVFCDPMFFTQGYSSDLQRELLYQARQLEAHMQVPVVHAGSVLPVEKEGELAEGFCYLTCGTRPAEVSFEAYVRDERELDYDVRWVELLEMDGVAPYTYSEELPYDDLLQQHTPGVQERTEEAPALVVAVLPRADSPSADRYAAEREGETAWTMNLSDADLPLPSEIASQIADRAHTNYQFDSDARAWDEGDRRVAGVTEGGGDADGAAEIEKLPANYKAPSLDD